MKTIFRALLFVGGGIFMLAGPVRAQSPLTPDEYNALVTAVESTPSQPASEAPLVGSFYTITHGESWPPLPSDTLGLNFWSLGGNVFLLDDRGFGYGASRADASFEPPPFPTNGASGGSGGSNPYFTPQTYTSSDLWLQITNLVGSNATLIIHPPSAVTEGVYDVLTATNLTQPIDWQWLLRTDPGQTSLPISIGTNAGTFYALGKPNDFVANDSLGTNFWLVFPNVGTIDGDNLFSLYISSPLAATGTVTVPNQLNGNVLIVTNCGDTNVNGIYLLTNVSVNPPDYGISGDTDTNAYFKGSYVVFFDDYNGNPDNAYGWTLANSNSKTLLYSGSQDDYLITNLNEAVWMNNGDPASVPTTLCPQVPLVQSFAVAASNATRVPIPYRAMIGTDSPAGTNAGIFVTTSAPISVFALDSDSESSTAFTVYPTPMLGTNYCVMARESFDSFNDGVSEFAIIATETNTGGGHALGHGESSKR